MIQDVMIKDLETHTDERGFFRELIRSTDEMFGEGFGQWSHSMMFAGVVKGWHIHQKQVDWWYVATGLLRVALHDLRPQSPTKGETMEMLMGDHQPVRILKVPPGVAHGCKCIHGPAHLFYVTSQIYTAEDDGKIPYDEAGIGYEWAKGPHIR